MSTCGVRVVRGRRGDGSLWATSRGFIAAGVSRGAVFTLALGKPLGERIRAMMLVAPFASDEHHEGDTNPHVSSILHTMSSHWFSRKVASVGFGAAASLQGAAQSMQMLHGDASSQATAEHEIAPSLMSSHERAIDRGSEGVLHDRWLSRQRWNMTFNDWELKFGGPVVFYSIDNDEISPPKISRSLSEAVRNGRHVAHGAKTHGHWAHIADFDHSLVDFLLRARLAAPELLQWLNTHDEAEDLRQKLMQQHSNSEL